MELIWLIIRDTAIQAVNIILPLGIVIVVLLVAVELLRESGWMVRLTDKLGWAAKAMGIPNEGMFGVVVGLVGGISYGSSIIYDITQSLNLNRTQLNAMFILVAICHAIVEETAVYAATGANVLYIMLCRAVFGVGFVALYRLSLRMRSAA